MSVQEELLCYLRGQRWHLQNVTVFMLRFIIDRHEADVSYTVRGQVFLTC